MGNVFASMFLSDIPVFQADGAWVGAVVEARRHAISIQNVITVFSQSVAEQLCDQNVIFPIFRLNAKNRAVWRRVDLILDLRKNGLCKLDYFSKMS